MKIDLYMILFIEKKYEKDNVMKWKGSEKNDSSDWNENRYSCFL